MKQLSNEIRKSKEGKYTSQESFNRWVEEYAYVHDISIEDTIQLAIFKQENREYTGQITRRTDEDK